MTELKATRRDVLIAAIACFLFGTITGAYLVRQWPDKTIAPSPRTVVFVYESSEMALPVHWHEARLQLEERDHTVYVIDDDVITGGGDVPVYLVPAIEHARRIGLPALIVLQDDLLLLGTSVPDTWEKIVGAVHEA